MFRENANISPKGKIIIKFLDKDNKVIEVKEIDNLVVLNARKLIADMFYNPDATYKLNKLWVGNCGLDVTSDMSLLEAPKYEDTALINAIYTTDTTGTTRSVIQGREALSNTFEIPANAITNPDGSPSLICEFGLFTSSNEMFSRVVAPVIKSAAVGLSIEWIILF